MGRDYAANNNAKVNISSIWFSVYFDFNHPVVVCIKYICITGKADENKVNICGIGMANILYLPSWGFALSIDVKYYYSLLFNDMIGKKTSTGLIFLKVNNCVLSNILYSKFYAYLSIYLFIHFKINFYAINIRSISIPLKHKR